MWVLAIKTTDGQQANFVSPTKNGLKEYLGRAKETNRHWRLWHNGWVDGSIDAWKQINSIYFQQTTILF